MRRGDFPDAALTPPAEPAVRIGAQDGRGIPAQRWRCVFLCLTKGATEWGVRTSSGSLAAHIDANCIALGVSRIHLPTGEDRSREGPSLDDVRQAKFLIAVGRGFSQDQFSRLSQHQKLSTDCDQTVETELRLRPLDLAGLPIQATQGSGRGPGALGVITV